MFVANVCNVYLCYSDYWSESMMTIIGTSLVDKVTYCAFYD